MTAISKAEALGPSAAFSAAAVPRSSRRDAFQQGLGVQPDPQLQPEGVLRVPVEDISLNPDNPRSDLGDLTNLSGSLKTHGQKTAISIMSRETYLAANPEREDALEPNTRYVAIDGNSRLAAAREAGLTTIKVMIDDELGANPDELLESALVANIHRKDLDHLDEARALKKLLKVHGGSQEALAARLHRSQGWISQRLGLLTLTPELKERLVKGEESATNLRAVGRKPADQQQQALEELKAKQAAAKEARRAAVARPAPEPVPQPAVHYDVMEPPASPEPPTPAEAASVSDPHPVTEAPQATATQPDTAPPPGPSEPAAPASLPEPGLMALPERQRSQLLHEYVKHAGSVEAMVADLSRGLPEDRVLQLGQILRDVANGMLQSVAAPS